MRISTTSALVFSAFFLFSCQIFAQKHAVVQMEGETMRTPLQLSKGQTALSLCGLSKGQAYQLVAAPRAAAPQAEVSLGLPVAARHLLTEQSGQMIRFVAEADCADLLLQVGNVAENEQTPCFLTVVRENKPSEIVPNQADQAVLQVQGGMSAKELVENVLVGGGCFEIKNVTYTGQPGQIGTFSNGLSNIGLSNGIIMATGGIQVAPGPNNSASASAGFGVPTPDSDLSTLTSGAIFDKAVIEFDFVPTQNQLSFEYVFASEEYCEYVGDIFNDVFGFFISGPGIVGTQNIALVPNTQNTPITINTINHTNNTQYYTHNIPNFNLSCPFVPAATGQAPQELQYDGFTKKMVAVANVIPCETYRIKLKIADVIDGVWDSAVFLKANSFNAGGSVLASPAYPGGFGSAYENCDAGHIRFKRGNSDLSQPLTVHFNVSGTATPGVDYVPLVSPVVIPAGQSELLVPVQVIPDMLVEGSETILVTIPNTCSCTQSVIEFVINDRPELLASLESQTLCFGETALLVPLVYGGLPDRQYLWSTGETTVSISPSASGAYSVTVFDGCADGVTAAAELNFVACSGCSAQTFWLNISEAGADLRGNGIYESPDGNLFVTGLKQDSALLIKMTPQGDMLWMRAFDVLAGENDRVADLLVDSDGMLVGCGYSGNAQSLGAFAFRYDPVTNNIQWLNTFANESPRAYGIVELPNGNYLIYDQANNASSDARFLEITRQDGAVLEFSPLTRNLRHQLADQLVSAVVQGDKLYATGRTRYANFLANDRHSLLRFDLSTATVDWANAGHIDPNTEARFVGADLILDNGAVVSTYFGNESGSSLIDSRIYLQKSSLDGDLLWLKRYEVAEAGNAEVEEVVSVPDGYVLFARDRGTTDGLYLLKTDKDGELLWAKKATESAYNDFLSTQSNVQSQLLVQGDRMFWVSTTENLGTGTAEMLVVKTDLDANLEGVCVLFQPLDVAVSSVPDAVSTPLALSLLPAKEEAETLVAALIAVGLDVESICRLLILDSVHYRICAGNSVEIGGVVFEQDTVFSMEISGSNGACDTLRTYTVQVLPLTELTESISFCPGSTVTIGGQVYDQSGTVTLTMPGTNGACDTIVTYTLTLLPQPTIAQTITFCPGETVVLGGSAYTEPGIVVLTLPNSGTGCDTIATYTLVKLAPAPSNISLACPNAITIGQPSGTNGAVVSYAAPTAASDCPCPGLELNLAQGLPSGSLFPQGVTQVCYVANDICGQTASCCFSVTIDEEEACDVKVSGCLKFELLTITEDAGKNRTYRVRVTNNCANKLLYTAIQVPQGVMAMSPPAFSTYTAPSGNTYAVRNPNFSPQYSVRFSSLSDSINLGESDIFRYTLPAQSNVTFIHVMTRLAPYVYVGAHLNTFYCPIGVTPLNADDPAGEERESGGAVLGLGAPSGILLFPNPTSGEIFVEMGSGQSEVAMSLFDGQGRMVFAQKLRGDEGAQLINLPESLANGLYFAHFRSENGGVYRERVVLQR